jgi:hypothetical protein
VSDRVTVLFVGASGRSGSTLVGRVLGQSSDFFDVGELRFIWERGLLRNQLCGCGRAFHSCEFWNAVGEEAFGGFDQVNVDEVLALKSAVDRQRYIPHHILAAKRKLKNPGMLERLDRYGDILERLYRAILNVSGAKVIVDSSKAASYAFMLNALPFIELRLVYLQRDSRAVAYSWSRRKLRPEIWNRKEFMSRIEPLTIAREWPVHSCLLSQLSRMVTFSTLLRYEDFVRDPAFWTTKVLTELEFEAADGPHVVRGHRVTLASNHSVAGNPMRFQVGDIDVRPDEEWKAKMRGVDKTVVTALTWPLLYRYGYLGSEKRQ